MPDLRENESGPFIVGNNVGDLLRWDGSTWLATAPNLSSGFNFILASRDDLVAVVAPVAGVFTLPAGSYSIKGPIALLTGERMEVPAVGGVTFYGMGENQVISGDAAGGALLTLAAGAEFTGFNVFMDVTGAGNNPCISIANGTQATMFGGSLTSGTGATSKALEMIGTVANHRFVGMEITGTENGVEISAASSVRFVACEITALDGVGLVITGSSDTYLTGCTVVGDVHAITVDHASADLFCSDNHIINTLAASSVIQLINSETVEITGGRVSGPGTLALAGVEFIAGNQEFTQIDTFFRSCTTCVLRTAGTTRGVNVRGGADDNCVNGVDWAAASAPSDALLIAGFNAAVTNFAVNFTAASARVNVKACSDAAGLVAETAIVP